MRAPTQGGRAPRLWRRRAPRLGAAARGKHAPRCAVWRRRSVPCPVRRCEAADVGTRRARPPLPAASSSLAAPVVGRSSACIDRIQDLHGYLYLFPHRISLASSSSVGVRGSWWAMALPGLSKGAHPHPRGCWRCSDAQVFSPSPEHTPDIGFVQRKPGRGDTTLSMSCFDKITRWSVVGIQAKGF